MPHFFEIISLSISSIVGSLSILLSIFSWIISKYVERSKLDNANETTFDMVLSSDNIITLGNYLDDTLGKFNIHEYTNNVEIQKRVDQYLERIQNFIGTNEDIAKEIVIEDKELIEIDKSSIIDEKFSDEFKKILYEVRAGEPWNALARLRRHIEIILRNMAQIAGFSQGGHTSVRRLLNFLERSELIDEYISRQLSYAISVCNKAVHGADISMGEAEEAIFHAQIALEKIESNKNLKT